jgi:carboxymethylenebutenolidase
MHESPLEFVLENQKGMMVTFPVPGGNPGNGYEIKAAAPTNNWLLVIQEWWGLNDHIKQEAENYYTALDGKVNVMAVDLYDGKIATSPDSAMSYIKAAMGSNRKENILSGALSYAGSDAKIFTVGWCFGGMMSLQTGIMAGKQGKATIMYYGQPEMDDAKLKKLNADVLGIFGTLDKSIPNETVDQFAAKMKSLGKSFQLERYEAPHAFANPSNPSYNAAAREDAFKKSIAFLKSHLN